MLVTTKSYLLQVFAPVLDRVATKFCVAVKGMLAEIRKEEGGEDGGDGGDEVKEVMDSDDGAG